MGLWLVALPCLVLSCLVLPCLPVCWCPQCQSRNGAEPQLFAAQETLANNVARARVIKRRDAASQEIHAPSEMLHTATWPPSQPSRQGKPLRCHWLGVAVSQITRSLQPSNQPEGNAGQTKADRMWSMGPGNLEWHCSSTRIDRASQRPRFSLPCKNSKIPVLALPQEAARRRHAVTSYLPQLTHLPADQNET